MSSKYASALTSKLFAYNFEKNPIWCLFLKGLGKVSSTLIVTYPKKKLNSVDIENLNIEAGCNSC